MKKNKNIDIEYLYIPKEKSDNKLKNALISIKEYITRVIIPLDELSVIYGMDIPTYLKTKDRKLAEVELDYRAKIAYNKYHKGNERKESDGTIVLTTPEAVRAFNEMMSSMSKEELYYRVCALLEILEEAQQKENENNLTLK